MKELLGMVYETPNTIDLAIVVQMPNFEETFISDNLRCSYQPARAEGLIFRLIGTFVQKLDLDYHEFIDVLKGDLEDDLFDVDAMRKLKRPSQKLSEDKFKKAEFCYKVNDFWHPNDEGGMAWNDPEIGIEWPHLKGDYPGSPDASGYTLDDGTKLNMAERDQEWKGLKDTFKF